MGRKCLPLVDCMKRSKKLWQQFSSACEFISNAIGHGGNILVHCMNGRNRSATALSSWLIRCCGMTSAGAISHLKLRRPVVNPNMLFKQHLKEWETRKYKRALVPKLVHATSAPKTKVCP